MAYQDSFGDNAELLRRTITGFADLSGRSRRTEVIYYWIATALAGVIFEFLVTTLLPASTAVALTSAFQVATMIPMFALLVRRLHDQNKSAQWSSLYFLAVILRIPVMIAELRGNVDEILAAERSPANLLSGLCGIIIIVLCLIAGTNGPNSYGPDPRLEA
ncbi:DUF805 domain-containing protein [Sphingomonas lycopersici]|uniref:DUF805 domain-containing protein n=1 Tax=Sphingomonas lycopersici TaxID=2951807 RepID=A0AA42CRN1_9SPHN|nr:DUF805 domain-containing protein [Sphingomonas lycopersici]MCW6536282.1 DUF805 domain-containing protein [Sphingomonas lycopersici]